MEIKPFKIRDLTPEKSKIVQETLFKNGYKWSGSGTVIQNYKDMHVYTDGKMYSGIISSVPELTFEEFERLYITEEELPEFKVGDWVITKDYRVHNIVLIHNSGRRFKNQDNIHNDVKDILRLATPEEISKAKGEFVLPEKWRLKRNVENEKFINNWRQTVRPNAGKLHEPYINQEAYGVSERYGEEITFDQFKKYVLKEGIKEKVMDKEELLKEAKRRYPVGSKIKGLLYNKVYVVNPSLFGYYDIEDNKIITDGFGDSVYLNGKWAEIVQDTLKIEDLVEGEIYYHKCDQFSYIIKFSKLGYNNRIEGYCNVCLNINSYDRSYANTTITELRVASQEEKDWLNACIKANKFIPKEEALKSKNMTFDNTKWYKVVDGKEKMHSGSTYYVKGKFESKSSYDKTPLDLFKEYIRDTKYYSNNVNLGEIGTYSYVEVLLSEIQQYLPDGHKDKQVEKWSVGTYVVFLIDYGYNNKGTISKITYNSPSIVEVEAPLHSDVNERCNLTKDRECKWFPTLKEAEEFSKQLLGMNVVLPITPSVGYKLIWGEKVEEEIDELPTFKPVVKNKNYFEKELDIN